MPVPVPVPDLDPTGTPGPPAGRAARAQPYAGVPGGLPALRLLPAPPCEPPYDDEQAPAPVLRLVPASAPAAPGPLRLLPAPTTPAPTTPAPTTPAPPAPTTRSEARRFAHALVQRLLEAQAGVRPLPQLQRHTTPELYEALEQAVAAAPRATGARPTGRSVLSLHVQERPEGVSGRAVAEVCATVRRGQRAATLALRLEDRDGRWLCTDLLGV